MLRVYLTGLVGLFGVACDVENNAPELTPGRPEIREVASAPSLDPADAMCVPPSADHRIDVAIDALVERLVGQYDLTLVATVGFASDSVTRGQMRLIAADDRRRVLGANPEVLYPAHGAASVDFSALGPVQLAYSLLSTDPDQPGVQAVYEPTHGHLQLVFGAATSVSGAWTDVGIGLDVHELTPVGMTGLWKDIGRVRRNGKGLRGYFCARRR